MCICTFLSLATQISTKTYLRFSSEPIEDIKMKLYLQSEEFVLAMFETMVLYLHINVICTVCAKDVYIHVTNVMK